MAEITREDMGSDDESFYQESEIGDEEDQFDDEITGEDVQDVEDVDIAEDEEDKGSLSGDTSESDLSYSNNLESPDSMLFAKRMCYLWVAICMTLALVLGFVTGNVVHSKRKQMGGHPPSTYGNPQFGEIGSNGTSPSGEPLWDPSAMGPGMHAGSEPGNGEQTEEELLHAKRKRHFTTLVVEWSGAASIATPTSPARLALDWILDEDPFRLTTADRTMDIQQRFIMAVFYFSTLGNHWGYNRTRRRSLQGQNDGQNLDHLTDNANNGSEIDHIIKAEKDLDAIAHFLTYRDVCHWSTADGKNGVFCNDNGIIEKLEFRDFGLGGVLPRELGFLSSLTAINAEYNDIEGSIPTYIGLMSNLSTMKFENNLLTGRIPKEISNLKKLQKLDLDGNNFDGPLPTEIGELESVVKIEIGGSHLTGSIPTEIGNLRESLQKLDLRDNKFSGQIPTHLGNLKNLGYLDLENNNLSGAVPIELGAATSLEMLYLNGNILAGSLDATFCNSDIAFFEFVADCRGAAPEITCSCCTSCCSPQGSNCTTLIDPLEGSTVPPPIAAPTPTAKPWPSIDYPTHEPTSKPAAPPIIPTPTTGVTVGTATAVSVDTAALKAILAAVSDVLLLDTKHTNQYKAFMWMARVDPSPIDVESTPRSMIIQKYIMVLIYISTNGKAWNEQNLYLTEASVCDWIGLTCNENGEIVSVVLEHNNLDGTIVSEIGQLPSLRKLHLGMNFLQGWLPSEIGLLSNLDTLDVFDNPDITGPVPAQISIQTMPNIERINIVGTGIWGDVDLNFCPGNGDGSRYFSANCLGDQPSVVCSCCAVCCDSKGENCKDSGNGN